MDDENIIYLLEISYVRSTGYLARAVVNTVLKGGKISQDLENDPEPCKMS